jgi:hypothetical protein
VPGEPAAGRSYASRRWDLYNAGGIHKFAETWGHPVMQSKIITQRNIHTNIIIYIIIYHYIYMMIYVNLYEEYNIHEQT